VETLPAIRSPVLSGGQGAGSVLVLEDGVPIRAPGFANINQEFESSWDFAQRVEVTRGPGSALYGSNAVHGLINVITRTPGRAGYSYLGEVEGGSFGRAALRSEAMIGAPDDPGRGFLGLAFVHEDGWRDAAGLDKQHGLIGWDADVGGWSIASRLVLMNLEQETAGFVVGPEAYRDSARSRRNDNPEAFRNEKLARGHVALSRDFGTHSRLTMTPYARWIETDLLQHFLPSRALEQTGQSGGGVQTALYVDPSDDLSLIFGVDADQTRGSLREFQSQADTCPGASPCAAGVLYPQGLHYNYEVDARVLAAYAQANWAFADKWRLIAGLRGESVTYEYDNQTADGTSGRFRRPADREDTFENVTPKLGVVRAFEGGGSVYLNLARGARAPQTSDLYSLQINQQPGAQEAETIESVELGVRKPIGEGRFEIALYRMDKENGAFRNAAGFTVTNAKTSHQGVEVSAQFPIGERFGLSGWASYAEHKYEFTDTVATPGESVFAGDDVDSAPRWMWNGAVSYEPRDDLRLELSWTHMGEYFTNASNTARYDGHDVLHLRAEWKANDNATIFTAVRNLTNTDYAERADFAFGNDRYFPGEDRAFTLGVRGMLN
jgi:outer membrane receptor protein involved in Fe transport